MATPLPGVWGIDLGQCALKAIRLQMLDGEVTATAFDYIEHPKILSQPDADPDELTREALQQFLSRNSIRGDMVLISVPGQSGLARFVKLPPVEEKKIADIVRFEAKQQIPFPLDEVVWDYQKVGAGVVSDGFAMETEIGLFAMKRDMVYRAIQQFKDVNVEVHVVQMSPLALCNYVAYDLLGKDVGPQAPPAEGEEVGSAAAEKRPCIVALDIGTDNSNLVITDGDKIIWQRPIPLGGNHFTRVLTKDLKLTFAKAEHLKRNAVKSPDLKKILSSLKPVLNDFVGEVQRSLGYFTNTHRDATIEYMIGLGNAFRLPGLQKYLQEKLQLEVRKLGQLERVKGEQVLNAPTFSENVMSFAVSYGLALQGLEKTRLQTNLLPYEIRVERIVRGKKPWAAAAAAALLLAVAGLALGRSMEKAAVTGTEIDAAKKRVDVAMTEARKLMDEFKTEEEKIKKSQRAIRMIGANGEERFNWQHLYQFVNLALPRANGEKLTEESSQHVEVRKKYLTPNATKALADLEIKRFATSAAENPEKAAENEEFIKKHLIQVNVEGILAMYSEDLSGYFKALVEQSPKLVGMKNSERDTLENIATNKGAGLPKDGWVVEIRGYTYNKGGEEFVINTILENLAYPKNVNPKLPQKLEEEVLKNISFLVLFKNEVIRNPVPGVFQYIQQSVLPNIVGATRAAGGGGDKDRAPKVGRFGGEGQEGAKGGNQGSNWRPIGDIAQRVFGSGGAPGGTINRRPESDRNQPTGSSPELQPRTEFILLFVWREPQPKN
ncbi:MAG: type IV pilus assembly protein PilM [Planctomycetes bacterium]|nr:type IV pilus assembly protein PilM [Planctomycetota bacterium]